MEVKGSEGNRKRGGKRNLKGRGKIKGRKAEWEGKEKGKRKDNEKGG